MCFMTDAYWEELNGTPCPWMVYNLCLACSEFHGWPAKVECNFKDASSYPQKLSFEIKLLAGFEKDNLPEICFRLLQGQGWKDFKITDIKHVYES